MTSTSLERARAALNCLNPTDRDVWVRAAMCIKSEFGEEGFEAWDAWGSQADGYKASAARSVWKSVKADGKVTIASLFYDAKQAGWKDTATHKKPTKAEIEARQAAAARAKAAAEEEAIEHAEAAARAVAIWEAAVPCTSHPYLDRKGVQSYGLRIGRWERVDADTGEVVLVTDRALLVPIRDRQRQLWSLQCIQPDADKLKLYLKGGAKQGHFFALGAKPQQRDGQQVFVLAEGYATAASLHEATGHMVLCCFDVSNLMAVARQLRDRLPDALIVFAADNDDQTVGNPGVTKARAAAAAVGGLVAVPPPGDFNDLHLSGGLEAVALVLEDLWIQSTLESSLIAPSTEAPPLSEDWLALAFAGAAMATFRFSPGLGWMRYDGVVWARDEQLLHVGLAREVCRDAAATAEKESDQIRITSSKTIAAVLTLARSDPRLNTLTQQWDSDPLVLNTTAGLVDLRTGATAKHSGELFTQVTTVGPDATMDCPVWLKFLAEVFPDGDEVIEFIQRSMGYWLTADRREQVIHFFYGAGANGKSILVDLTSYILGSYCVKLPATTLMKHRGERHPTELTQIWGRRLAVSSELAEDDVFNESLLKELTGDSKISARYMRQDFFEFSMTQKHLIVGNFLPRIRGGDAAIARRLLLIPFKATFSGDRRDLMLLEKLKAEAPGILAWMIKGAVKWHATGLAVPGVISEISREYFDDHDDLKLWLAECCELGDSYQTRATLLYKSYVNWKKSRGDSVPSMTLFGGQLKAVPGLTKRRSGGVIYGGIRLGGPAGGNESVATVDVGMVGTVHPFKARG